MVASETKLQPGPVVYIQVDIQGRWYDEFTRHVPLREKSERRRIYPKGGRMRHLAVSTQDSVHIMNSNG